MRKFTWKKLKPKVAVMSALKKPKTPEISARKSPEMGELSNLDHQEPVTTKTLEGDSGVTKDEKQTIPEINVTAGEDNDSGCEDSPVSEAPVVPAIILIDHSGETMDGEVSMVLSQASKYALDPGPTYI